MPFPSPSLKKLPAPKYFPVNFTRLSAAPEKDARQSLQCTPDFDGWTLDETLSETRGSVRAGSYIGFRGATCAGDGGSFPAS
jgi:hypothetical protein